MPLARTLLPLALLVAVQAAERVPAPPVPPPPLLEPDIPAPDLPTADDRNQTDGVAPTHGRQRLRPASGNARQPRTPPAKPAPPPAAAEPPAAGGPEPERTGPPPPAVEHDIIILVNRQRFRGTVLSDQPDPAWVAINTGSGVMRIPRDTIAKVELGLTARIGRLKPDDLDGTIALARECRAYARSSDAHQLLARAVTLPGCDLDTRGLYAQLVDELEGADKALPLYLAYRNAGGGDAAILARLAELETARNAWEEQMRALGLDPGASLAAGSPVPAATASTVEEGYEKYKWNQDSLEWSSPAKPTTLTLVTPEGPRKVMQIDVEPHPSKPDIDKAAIILRQPLTLRPGQKLNLLAANRGSTDLRLGIAVKTGSAWTYYESLPKVVPGSSSGQEFVALTFDLGAADFKSKASNWAHTARIGDLDRVRELQLLIHNGRFAGSLWVAGISFAGGE